MSLTRRKKKIDVALHNANLELKQVQKDQELLAVTEKVLRAQVSDLEGIKNNDKYDKYE